MPSEISALSDSSYSRWGVEDSDEDYMDSSIFDFLHQLEASKNNLFSNHPEPFKAVYPWPRWPKVYGSTKK